MKKKLAFHWNVLKKTVESYTDSNVFIQSAGLAYSAIFSIPGLLIMIIWLAGIFFGEQVVRGEIIRQIQDVLGADAAESIQNIIQKAMIEKDNFWMKAIGVLALIFGGTTLFFMLQKCLNSLWGIEPKPKQAILKYVLDRANSLGLILMIGLLMVITMVLSTIVTALNHIITQEFGLETYKLFQLVNFGVGFVLIMIIFGVIFKVLPDVKIQWKAVYAGAFLTAILFTIGKYLLTIYFAEFDPTSVYGTAGTIVLIMMWINYSFLIILFGAEYTKVYAILKGYRFVPAEFATWEDEEDAVIE
ncbi:membrane protein [Balneicella halophila]|uniref:Membrane protein n=1 Tax=Balneicella halophila TaxID=1537566 RepID=A0A7L4UQI0_BALHA|nr:YihY/virulence factor BrkB family protein [Balneicella halophila]PVX50852.1 membrane protein [Balneicella halophila]